MNRSSFLRAALLALLAGSAAGAFAQTPPAEPAPAADPVDPDLDEEEAEEDGEEIVVTGQRLPGAVIGDIAPEVSYGPRDIRTFGAGSISELLEQLAPQTRSGRGRGGERPVVLLNGRRISGFSEIRNIPPEAIIRVDILPEEVALKYGYRADQRVVNFVLRPRFRAVTAELSQGLATEGGRGETGAEASLLTIGEASRLNLAAELRRATSLVEQERDLIDADPFRTLLPATDSASLNATYNRNILGDVSATVNGRFETTDSRSLLGLPVSGDASPLARAVDTDNAHLGIALNGDVSRWRWSFTGNYDRDLTRTLTDRERSDPPGRFRDRARSLDSVANGELVANGALATLPAGDLSATFKVGGETRDFSSDSTRAGIAQSAELGRDRVNGQANFDLPIASRRRAVLAPLGDLSLNFNIAGDRLSDFGTLTTIGGVTWEPIARVTLIASVTDEDGAPSVQQLGNPSVLTPNVRVFDFARGATVDISRIDGGNPDLLADNRRVVKFGINARPFGETELALNANYTNTRIRSPIASFPTITPAIEAAFPDRFVRDADGDLLSIDNRPVNFARSDREELRTGITFSRRIGPEPERRGGRGAAPGETEEQRQARRERWRREGGFGGQRGPGGGARGGGGRGFGGGGFGGGGGRGGRLQLAAYHTWRFTDSILIRDGVPELDLLDGAAVGDRGGRPRHEVEVQAGLFRDGFGARLDANWQSATRVDGAIDGSDTGDLFFDDFATVNLRLFANLGQQRALVRRHRWLRGTRVSLSVTNLFNNRIDVTDATGVTPLGYQGALLDPLGRSIRISFRKLFF